MEMTIKPISEAVKQGFIETLSNLEESYNANYEESVKAFNQAVYDRKDILIREFADERDYWQFEYAKINQIKRIIQDYPECACPAYLVTAETENETVFEVAECPQS